MGEEPEWLRAQAESALLRPTKVRANGRLIEGGVRIGVIEAGDLARGILSLLAEVERLEERLSLYEKPGMVSAVQKVIELQGEVERLADENHLQAACLDSLEHRLFGDVQGRSRDALEAQVERLAGERDAAVKQAVWLAGLNTKKQAECERLAGRVAALETALKDICGSDWGERLHETPFQFEQRLHKLAHAVLADVGGSE